MTRVSFGAAADLPLAERGTYDLTIREFKKSLTKAGQVYYRVKFSFDEGKHPAFTQAFFGPSSNDDLERATRRVQQFRRLLDAFAISYDDDLTMEEFEPSEDECIGVGGSVTVVLGTDKDQDGSEYDVNRIVLGAPRTSRK